MLFTESPAVVQSESVDLEDAVIALSAVPTDPCSSTRVNSVPAQAATRDHGAPYSDLYMHSLLKTIKACRFSWIKSP